MVDDPLFPPKTVEEARQAILDILLRSPFVFGYLMSRWTLKLLRQQLTWLKVNSDAALWRVLRRLKIHRKQGQSHVRSPDHSYDLKKQTIADARREVRHAPQRKVLVYLDEFSVKVQPPPGPVYAMRGTDQPRATQAPIGFPEFRIIAALNALTGKVTFNIVKYMRVGAVAAFMTSLAREYGDYERIYVVLDNWPIHYHADVLARLRPQLWVHPHMRPTWWSDTPSPRAIISSLPIEFLPLPTYASWLNPIEKLWRKLKQEVLYMHPYADHQQKLRNVVTNYLQQFQHGSHELLRYVGIKP